MGAQGLTEAIVHSWSIETCYGPYRERWSANPACGQCAVTALIIQDACGGELLYCRHTDHYWNRLPDMSEIDLTREQFPEGTRICTDAIVERETLMKNPDTRHRYEILKERVAHRLSR